MHADNNVNVPGASGFHFSLYMVLVHTRPPAHPIVKLTRDSCETGELASDSK